jgi:hypothetical protein
LMAYLLHLRMTRLNPMVMMTFQQITQLQN